MAHQDLAICTKQGFGADESQDETIMIDNRDFPCNFFNGRHPEDLKVLEKPIEPEFILNEINLRLILRNSFEVNNGYLPMSFLIDTGAVGCLYFSEEAMKAMIGNNLIIRAREEIVRVRFGPNNGKIMKAAVQTTPKTFEPANIMGLKMLLKLGLRAYGSNWCFEEPVSFF